MQGGLSDVLYLPAGAESVAEGDLVGILNVGTSREATGDFGHFDGVLLEKFAEVEDGAFSFDVGIHAEDDLFDGVIGTRDAGDEFFDAELIGSDSFDDADSPS